MTDQKIIGFVIVIQRILRVMVVVEVSLPCVLLVDAYTKKISSKSVTQSNVFASYPEIYIGECKDIEHYIIIKVTPGDNI